MAKSGKQISEIPEPTVTKFGVDNYVGDISPARVSQLKAIAPVGASRQINEVLLSRGFSCFLLIIFSHVPRLNRRNGFTLFDS